MIDGTNGPTGLAPAPSVPETTSSTAPPAGEPAGAPAVEPDVEVAISDRAQARMEAMMAPAEAGSETAGWDAKSGGMEFGVDKGGFDWALDVREKTTQDTAAFASQEGWSADSKVVNGVLIDEANAANRIAMGDIGISEDS